MNTQLIDVAAAPVTTASAKYVRYRLDRVEDDIADLDNEIAAMLAVRDDLQAVAARYRARLGHAVSLLPPLVEVADGPGEELPLEAEAHAALAQDPRGQHPYGPSTMPDLPQVNGHVQVPGEFASSQVNGAQR
ncbi:hypothetical protein OG589_14775 [Sphaerisporangium sp. NBC_01403]|uniref:hypothetical protein n=1 Tax=Sphaerisporangium sp. NBC_01403 TaxID=2903599 RepID=UPI0032529E48